jgi:hypothetical protein
MSFRDVLEKFVVLDKKEPGRPVEKVTPTAVPTPALLSASAVEQPDDLDLSDIYEQERISPAPFAAEQALELLDALPKELTPETRRQVFNELLRARSTVPPEVVLEDARRKVGALTASVTAIPGQVTDFVAALETEIAHLENQIREKREAMEQAQTQQRRITQKCQAEIERLTVVLRLLGADTSTEASARPQ